MDRQQVNEIQCGIKNIYLSTGNIIQKSNIHRDSETWKEITLQKGSWMIMERKIGTNLQCRVTALRFNAILVRICGGGTSQNKKDSYRYILK